MSFHFSSGALLALASAALFGASTPFAKLLLGAIDPWLLAGLLYLGSGLGLMAAQAMRRALGIAPADAPLRRSDLPWLAAVVLAGGVIGPVLLMFGLTRTPAAAAALLLNLEGIFTLVIAWTVFKENVDRRIAIGAAAIIAGALALSWQPGASFGASWGALAIAGACLAWGIDNNLTRKLSGADPALRHLGTARTGAYFSTAPFLGAVFAILLLGEALTLQLVIAAALMAVGVWLHLTERHEHEHVHEPLTHEHRHVHDEHHQHAHGPADPAGEPHAHVHAHARMVHRHPHYPDLHHRHTH